MELELNAVLSFYKGNLVLKCLNFTSCYIFQFSKVDTLQKYIVYRTKFEFMNVFSGRLRDNASCACALWFVPERRRVPDALLKIQEVVHAGFYSSKAARPVSLTAFPSQADTNASSLILSFLT